VQVSYTQMLSMIEKLRNAMTELTNLSKMKKNAGDRPLQRITTPQAALDISSNTRRKATVTSNFVFR